MVNTFTVKIGDFEGPLDLLLQLIEHKKLHISEVSLASVADDYLAHLANINDLPKKDVADFLIIASTLVFIKSLSLLPTLKRTEEENASIEDLEKRLALYQRFKELGEGLKKLYSQQSLYFRQESKVPKIVFAPSSDINKENILAGVKNMLLSLPKVEILPKTVVKKVISLESVIADLSKRIQSSLKLKFNDFIADKKEDKVGIIVSFLSMLELVRQGILIVKQDQLFDDIDMETNQITTPRYDD